MRKDAWGCVASNTPTEVGRPSRGTFASYGRERDLSDIRGGSRLRSIGRELAPDVTAGARGRRRRVCFPLSIGRTPVVDPALNVFCFPGYPPGRKLQRGRKAVGAAFAIDRRSAETGRCNNLLFRHQSRRERRPPIKRSMGSCRMAVG